MALGFVDLEKAFDTVPRDGGVDAKVDGRSGGRRSIGGM